MPMPITGELAQLRAVVNGGLTLHLYTNAKAFACTDNVEDYYEPTFPGYTPKQLAGTAWTDRPGTPTKASAIIGPEEVFWLSEKINTVDVHGWFLTLPDGGLYFAEAFDDGPYDLFRARDAVVVQPVLVAAR